ncbi:isopentenyl-diphosphate Delta-isomerase (plasmid) [Ensifer adhaerens]|uniref:isopentenyl-diphosphate Delta-isomerase n=1 Tax=Ensifer adhaerens TaxID=106592 RepID=UPI0021017641|nr:isopentenyl-diphosphate Delta-isomerase [Ensifer adhaerens]UTV41915.1 isopentenyl-diphosphate Delta-isomerase [Ensifer adhaerens]
MNEETLILVDRQDNVNGFGEKLPVHQEGLLHRAFSIFLFDKHHRLMLQRRALEKYHSGGLWTNCCCGHPRPGEETEAAARRRLREEMGIDCELYWTTSFIYRSSVSNGLIEHEFDHVFVGTFNGEPHPTPKEAADWKWVEKTDLLNWISKTPDDFTVWFRTIFDRNSGIGVHVDDFWPKVG